MKHCAPKHGNSSAFTLIELLVAISLIVLLISLLIPGLQQARARATAVLCANHERQVLVGMTLYAQGNQSYFPHVATSSPYHYAFPDLLHAAGLLNASGTTAGTTPFVCPDYDMATYRGSDSRYYNTYAVNGRIVGYMHADVWAEQFPPVALTQIRNPAQVVVFGDGVYQEPGDGYDWHIYPLFVNGFEIGKYHTALTRYTATAWLRYAHRGIPQIAYCDGHVVAHEGPWITLGSP